MLGGEVLDAGVVMRIFNSSKLGCRSSAGKAEMGTADTDELEGVIGMNGVESCT